MYVSYYGGAISPPAPTGISGPLTDTPYNSSAIREFITGVSTLATAIGVGAGTGAAATAVVTMTGPPGVGAMGGVISLGVAQTTSLVVASIEHFSAAMAYSSGNSLTGDRLSAEAKSLDAGITGAVFSEITHSSAWGNLGGTAVNIAFASAGSTPAAVGIAGNSSLKDAINGVVADKDKPESTATTSVATDAKVEAKDKSQNKGTDGDFQNGNRPNCEESSYFSTDM
jgi:hypothetical protein